MRTAATLICAIALAGCGNEVGLVKKRWSQDLATYSFVPIYPPRGDVAIGDIRVHLDTGGSELFDSRLLWKQGVTVSTVSTPAVLPGVETVRLGAIDLETVGIMGQLAKIFGGRIEATDSLHIALKDLTTEEASGTDVATRFRSIVQTRLSDMASREVEGFCADAITLGYKGKMENVRVSVVTRLVRAGGISYFSGEGVATTEGGSDPQKVGENSDSLVGKTGIAARAVAAIGEEAQLKGSVVIGVEALMLKPGDFIPELAARCRYWQNYYEEPKLSAFASQSVGTTD